MTQTETTWRQVEVIERATMDVYRDCRLTVPVNWTDQQIQEHAKEVMEAKGWPFVIEYEMPLEETEDERVQKLYCLNRTYEIIECDEYGTTLS
jgi:hypothetical protein